MRDGLQKLATAAIKEGVFDGCSPDAEINHAVLLLGYGVKGVASESAFA